eukprot:472506_1
MGETFSLFSNTNAAEDALTAKEIESACPPPFVAQIQASFPKATKGSQVHIIWTALVKRALAESTEENLYFISQMHKARQKTGDDLKAFIETIYNECIVVDSKYQINISNDQRKAFLPGATAKPRHWPEIKDKKSLNDSPFEKAEGIVIALVAKNTLYNLKSTNTKLKKYVANEDYDNQLEFSDEFYDNELEQARGEYIDGGINGYNVGYRQGYNKGYNFGKNIGYGNNHGVTDPIIYLLISVMLCVCLLLCGVLTNVISCA